jgi:hypothetical protein
MWVWLAGAVAIYYFYSRQQSSSSSSQAANQQTDPAGNIGTIDPATGYVYGTPEDTAALAANNAGTSSTGTSAGTNATTGAQTYADNDAWGSAAVNYLVGIGIDATTANQAIQNYLSSQTLTTAQQGDVNLAIQAIGSPPSLPGPSTSNPTPVSTVGQSGTTTTTPTAPTVSAGHVESVTGSTAVVAWTGTGATSWRVEIVGPGKINGQTDTVSKPQATYGGLEAGHEYSVNVQPLVAGKPEGPAGKIDFKTTGGTPATTTKKT